MRLLSVQHDMSSVNQQNIGSNFYSQLFVFLADSFIMKIKVTSSPAENDRVTITVSADHFPTNWWSCLCFLQCRTMASHKRILSTLGNGPARRNLFGPVDREQLQEEYQAALRRDLEEASNRWGFDFILEKPLESSDFQWEGIPGTKVPLLYRSCMLDRGQPERAAEASPMPKGGRVEPLQSEKENVPCSPERCALKLENLEKTPGKMESAEERAERERVLKRKQTNITGRDLDVLLLNGRRCNFMWICRS